MFLGIFDEKIMPTAHHFLANIIAGSLKSVIFNLLKNVNCKILELFWRFI